MSTPPEQNISNVNSGLPAGKMPELRVMPAPADANVYGDVFGGWIMSQVDIAGSLPATRRANGRVATVAVNSFLFKQPVFVGDLLSFYADIVKTGNTSVTVTKLPSDLLIFSLSTLRKPLCIQMLASGAWSGYAASLCAISFS